VIIYLIDIYLLDIRGEEMARSNKTKYPILGILSQEDLSGYEVKKRIEERLSFYWNESFGQIYPTLKELRREGLLGSERVAQEGKPDKTVYKITEKGMAILREWLEEPVETERLRSELLLKLSFGNHTSTGTIKRHVDDFRESLKEKMKLMEIFERNLREVLEDHPDHPYQLVTVLFGKKTYQAWIDWCEEALALLGNS